MLGRLERPKDAEADEESPGRAVYSAVPNRPSLVHISAKQSECHGTKQRLDSANTDDVIPLRSSRLELAVRTCSRRQCVFTQPDVTLRHQVRKYLPPLYVTAYQDISPRSALLSSCCLVGVFRKASSSPLTAHDSSRLAAHVAVSARPALRKHFTRSARYNSLFLDLGLQVTRMVGSVTLGLPVAHTWRPSCHHPNTVLVK